jgi:hypothetical protein
MRTPAERSSHISGRVTGGTIDNKQQISNDEYFQKAAFGIL